MWSSLLFCLTARPPSVSVPFAEVNTRWFVRLMVSRDMCAHFKCISCDALIHKQQGSRSKQVTRNLLLCKLSIGSNRIIYQVPKNSVITLNKFGIRGKITLFLQCPPVDVECMMSYDETLQCTVCIWFLTFFSQKLFLTQFGCVYVEHWMSLSCPVPQWVVNMKLI